MLVRGVDLVEETLFACVGIPNRLFVVGGGGDDGGAARARRAGDGARARTCSRATRAAVEKACSRRSLPRASAKISGDEIADMRERRIARTIFLFLHRTWAGAAQRLTGSRLAVSQSFVVCWHRTEGVASLLEPKGAQWPTAMIRLGEKRLFPRRARQNRRIFLALKSRCASS